MPLSSERRQAADELIGLWADLSRELIARCEQVRGELERKMTESRRERPCTPSCFQGIRGFQSADRGEEGRARLGEVFFS